MGKDFRKSSKKNVVEDGSKSDYKIKKRLLTEESLDEEWFDDDDYFEEYSFGGDE